MFLINFVIIIGCETTHRRYLVVSVSVFATHAIMHFSEDIIDNWLRCTTEFSHDVFLLGSNGSFVGFSDVL